MTINPASLPTVPPNPQDGLPLQVTVGELPIGTVQKVGDYKILGTLGSGGMGIVYKAFDQKLGRIVALKMLQVGRDASHEEILRFRTEAEMLGRLQHPNIVQVFDFGIHEGAPFLVMEFVNGGSLEKRLQGTPQQPRRAAEWIEQIARAMHVAHENKVIHRDLKPANVLITVEGAPKITDFGLAKQMEASHGLTQTGAIMGTPSYMAPEQAEGKKSVGPPADIYSLGALLYECLTGRPPFRGATLQETLEQVCNADPAPPSRLVPRLPRDLQTICLKCLEKAPGRRYRTAGDLADDLKNWLDGLPVKARPTHSIERVIRYVARRPLRALLVLAAMAVVVMGVVIGVILHNQSQEGKIRDAEALTAKADRARDDARKSLQNLKEMLKLGMKGDLHTAAGLEGLEGKLNDHAKNLDKEDDAAADKAAVLADAFSQVAALWRQQGEADRAVRALDEAARLARFGPEQGGGSLEARMTRARIYQERGLVRAETSPEDGAKDCRAALALLDEMKAEAGDDVDYARLRAETLHDLAVATSNLPAAGTKARENEKEAQKYYEEAQKLLRALVRRPGATDTDRRNLARTLGYVGDLYLDMDNRRRADAAYWESHLLREDLANEKPREYEPRYQLARSWDNFGGYQARQRVLGTALYFYRQSERLRSELHRKQPDNKEYTLELAGVLNRMAELELFTLDQHADPKKLATIKKQLSEGAALMTDLIALMREDSRGDKETTSRAYSRLGECRSLQARAALARLALSPDNKEVIEEGRAAARAAGDDYAKLKDKRKLTKDELYQQAAAQFISLELYLKTRGENVKNPASFYDQPIKMLADSIAGGFCRLSAEEIARDRAFASIAGKEWFKELLKQAALKPGARAATASDSAKGQ